MRSARRALALGLFALVSLRSPTLRAAHPDGADVIRLLGSERARATFARVPGPMSALVSWTSSEPPRGVRPVAPGIGTIMGEPEDLIAAVDSSPGARLEVAPSLRPLLDRAGQWVHAAAATALGLSGQGVLVAVADSGLDVTHPDFVDANGHTRVAWMLDLSLPPLGVYPDLEAQFGITDATGNVVAGAVLDSAMIDSLRAAPSGALPQDTVGHGTHVTSIAAGNGELVSPSPYVGMAPAAGILFAKVMREGSTDIENGDLLDAAAFLMNRADAIGEPVVMNLSLGMDFGPHDGTSLLETGLASFVGPSHPGHAIVVSAGNSGDVSGALVHQSVYVPRDGKTRVFVNAALGTGDVEVWVTMHSGVALRVGLEGPDGEWIAPVPPGGSTGKNTSEYTAGVINGAEVSGSPIPAASNGAVVFFQGTWPTGQYAITLEGGGGAELYLQANAASGGAAVRVEDDSDAGVTSFASGLREGTINVPATHPGLLAVGCTVNRTTWQSLSGNTFDPTIPVLDSAGVSPLSPPEVRALSDGDVCWFSSAGPTATGGEKPEIAAPGGYVVGALSSEAPPGGADSIFSGEGCPPPESGGTPDPLCYQIDPLHAIAIGTSMSAPLVAGAVALLFESDPTLTQADVTTLLQAGAHRFRGAALFDDQSGPGELDIAGALAALAERKAGAAYLPAAATSWITVGAEFVAADGTVPLPVVLELRAADGVHRADLFDPSRLVLEARVDGVNLFPPLSRRSAGVWSSSVVIPPGHGGSVLELSAMFDGVALVPTRQLPVATTPWMALVAPGVAGGCGVGAVGGR